MDRYEKEELLKVLYTITKDPQVLFWLSEFFGFNIYSLIEKWDKKPNG